MRCEQVRHYILDQTLGSQPIPSHGPLYEHVQSCAACRSFLARVLEVEAALLRLPLYAAPAGLTRRILEDAVSLHQEDEAFIPWTLWLPLLSLLIGLSWAYLAFLANQGSILTTSFSPALQDLLRRLDQWISTQQPTISAVAISVVAGLLFTLLAVGLGLYVGRTRAGHQPAI